MSHSSTTASLDFLLLCLKGSGCCFQMRDIGELRGNKIRRGSSVTSAAVAPPSLGSFLKFMSRRGHALPPTPSSTGEKFPLGAA